MSSTPSSPPKFISADEWDDYVADQTSNLEALTDPRAVSVARAKFSRKDIADNFTAAFEAVGGVTRLAVYAHENYSEFIKLFAKLLPTQASSALDSTGEVTVKHVVPRTKLDELPPA